MEKGLIKKFIIQERESGKRLKKLNTMEEAENLLEKYEEDNQIEETYEVENYRRLLNEAIKNNDMNNMAYYTRLLEEAVEDFYEIVEVEEEDDVCIAIELARDSLEEAKNIDLNTMSIEQLEDCKEELDDRISRLIKEISFICNNTTEELISAEDINEVETMDSIIDDISFKLIDVEEELEKRYHE